MFSRAKFISYHLDPKDTVRGWVCALVLIFGRLYVSHCARALVKM